MAKLSDKSANGTSYHGIGIKSTLNLLRETIGKPQDLNNTGEDKTNVDYVCETEDGDVFTIYDWKEYRKIGDDEVINFHIGAHTDRIAFNAKQELHKQGAFVG
jgi:hypothetical protein